MAKTAPVALAMAILGALTLVAVLAIATQQMNKIGGIGSISGNFVLLTPSLKQIKRLSGKR